MIGPTASTAASSTDIGRNQGRRERDDDPDVTVSHKGGNSITHDEYRRMRELMFNEDVPEMERSSSSSSMLSVSSTSSCTSSLSTASSSKRRIFGPFWDGRRVVDGQEDASSGRAAARGCHDWGLGVVGGGGGVRPPPPGSHPFISCMSSTGSSRTLSYEARASFANMAFDRISAFEAGGGMYSEAGTSSVDNVPDEARRASLADADQGGSASCGEGTQPTERCSGSQDQNGHEKNSSGDRDRDRRSIFTSSSFSQPAPLSRRRHFLDRPEFRKERSASFTHRSIGTGSMFPSDPNHHHSKSDVVRRSSLRSKGESSSSRSDPNLRASVHFDPRVRVVEFRPSEVQHAGNGWSRWFTYN